MFCQIRNKAKEGRSFGNTLKRKEGRSLGNGGSIIQINNKIIDIIQINNEIIDTNTSIILYNHCGTYFN